MKKQTILKLIKDMIKRDFGGKIINFISRVSMVSEANSSINYVNHSDMRINKKQGCLLKTFKVKPIKENNNFLSLFSLENVINSSYKSLTDLTLQGCIRISSTALCENLGKLKILKSLDISLTSSVNDEVIETVCTFCKELEKINLSYCNQLTEESIKLISLNLTSLKAIDFSFCYNIRPGSITNLYQSKMSKIETIIAKGIAFESIDFQDISKLISLKTLSVNGCQLLDDRFLNIISKTSLRNLDIKSNMAYSTEGILKLLERLKATLRLLYIDNVYSINRKLRIAISKLQPDDDFINSDS